MVLVLPKARNFGEEFARSIGSGAGEGFNQSREKKSKLAELDKENREIFKATGIDLSGSTDPEMRKAMFIQQLKGKQEEDLFNKKQDLLAKELSKGKVDPSQFNESQFNNDENLDLISEKKFDPTRYSAEDLARITSLDKETGKSLQKSQDVELRENARKGKEERQKFESERSYHTGFTKESDKEINELRKTLPKVKNALRYARNAVETGNLSFFSSDKLADITGLDLFRTAKGAQLITAGKENLLNNMSRVSARAQNIWFEQRLNSMFPKIGQSKEANLIVSEMLEGEAALEEARIREFDKITEEDEEKYGFVKKDRDKRVAQNLRPYEKEILTRTSYRMKEIEEQELGLPELKKQVGKNVERGTPLTLAMAKLYKSKFGDNALEVAKKNGYYIPTLEEFRIFQQRPDEYGEIDE